jgi:hypothetical protein
VRGASNWRRRWKRAPKAERVPDVSGLFLLKAGVGMGTEEGEGMGCVEVKLSMRQRRILFSLAERERMRSP